MGRPKHYYEPGGVYLITAVTYRRETVFANPDNARIAHEDIAYYAGKFRAKSLAHVVMPDHVHWVLNPSPRDFEHFAREQREKGGQYAEAPQRYYLSKILQDYQRHVAYMVNKVQETRGAKVWQDGFRDDTLRDEDAVNRAIRYVVYNPVTARLAERPADYAYWGSISAPE